MTTPQGAERFKPFGTTIFAEMTALANEHQAVNLSQGFPDFEGPPFVLEAARDAIASSHNQYAPMPGIMPLRQEICRWRKRHHGVSADPATEVTVTAGCTGALAAVFMGLVNPGDEVVLFEPFYDSYRACVAMAGATPRYVQLRATEAGFVFDEHELREVFSSRTRAVLVNTPHNPTGKVYTKSELELILSLASEHDAIVIADEVYETLLFDGHRHVPLASLPGAAERVVSLSSIGKTFSVTGWKIGWSVANPSLTAGIRAAHQFLTYAVAHPLQHGAAAALRDGDDSITELTQTYNARRAELCDALADLGFGLVPPQGTYFVMADHTQISKRLGLEGDVEFCRWLTTEAGVAAIPPSAFYATSGGGQDLVRFAFCKTPETMNEAVRRLRKALA